MIGTASDDDVVDDDGNGNADGPQYTHENWQQLLSGSVSKRVNKKEQTNSGSSIQHVINDQSPEKGSINRYVYHHCGIMELKSERTGFFLSLLLYTANNTLLPTYLLLYNCL